MEFLNRLLIASKLAFRLRNNCRSLIKGKNQIIINSVSLDAFQDFNGLCFQVLMVFAIQRGRLTKKAND